MEPDGVDPVHYLTQVSRHIDNTRDAAQLNRWLDDLEYLYEVLDPQFQDLADDVMQRLRERLARTS